MSSKTPWPKTHASLGDKLEFGGPGRRVHGCLIAVLAVLLTPAVAVSFATAGAVIQSANDSLRVIATLPPMLDHFIALGDTDHDGSNEIVYGGISGGDLHYTIIEEHDGNQYSLEYTGDFLFPMAITDLDGDGKTDLVGQAGGWIRIFESTSATTYPTELVWESAPMSNVLNWIAVGDTDRDGHMEILHSENGFSGRQTVLHIFENTGDNSYQEVYQSTIPGGVGKKIIADFDGDGRTEIGLHSGGWVYVYEAKADNAWEITWRDSTGLQLGEAEGGVDSDGNGRPELFVMGNGPDGWTTIVYEARCDDEFARVASFSQNDGATGEVFHTMARLQGPSGPWSYLMGGFQHFWVHRAEAVGIWSLVEEVPTTDPLLNGLFAYDLNGNGRDEIVWTSSGSASLLLEAQADATETTTSRLLPLFQVTPNPVRGTATLAMDLHLANQARSVLVYDVRGRLVRQWSLDCRDPATQTWQTGGIAAGVYLLRLEDALGQPLVSTRATIIR